MAELSGYLIVGAVATAVTAATTPLVRRIARRRGWVAMPSERKVHTVPTPDVGGIAMFAGVVAAMFVAWRMDQFSGFFEGNSEPTGLLLGALVILLVGVRDDIREVSAPARVMATVFTGMILVWFGVTMFYFRVPFAGVIQLSDDWVPIVTVFWLLGMTQAVNLIDGLDGLAAGIVAIGSTAFFIYSHHLSGLGLLSEPNLGPLIAIVTVGVCVGFLPYNFNGASIFMGDGGAYLLGFLVAVSTSVVGGRADPTTQAFSSQTYFFLAPLVIPLIILGVPVFDVLFAIVRRVVNRQGFATADTGHLHHRLIRLGHGPRRAVAFLWGWTAWLSALVLYPVFNTTTTNFVPLALLGLVLFLYTVLHPDIERSRRDESTPTSTP